MVVSIFSRQARNDRADVLSDENGERERGLMHYAISESSQAVYESAACVVSKFNLSKLYAKYLGRQRQCNVTADRTRTANGQVCLKAVLVWSCSKQGLSQHG